MKQQKLTYRLLILSGGFLILIMAIFYFLYVKNKSEEFICKIPVPQNFCGTKNLNKKAEKGRKIFNQNCAACHKINFKSTGPALGKTDSIKYWEWLGTENNIIDSTKFSLLSIDYHKDLSQKALTSDELNVIFEYIKAK